MKEIVIGVVTIALSIVSSISSTSFMLGGKLAEHETRISNVEVAFEKMDDNNQKFTDALDTIKVDVAVTKNNVLWLRGANQDETTIHITNPPG